MPRLDSNPPPAAADGDRDAHPDSASPPPAQPSALEPLLALPITTAPTGGAARKAQPVPWTPQETAHLIQAYQEKWYSLKRGPLKAFQWEEVAITVAARCGYDDPSKTATQCRHKLEKLRKRYRSEKKKKMTMTMVMKKKKKKKNISSPPPSLVCWQFFHLMERLECGPLPISARSPDNAADTQMDDDDGEDFGNNNNNKKRKMSSSSTGRNFCRSSKSRSISHILRKRSCGGGGGGGDDGVFDLRNPMFRRPKRNTIDNEEDETDESDDGDHEVPETGGFFPSLASEIRKLARRFAEIEGRKMEIMRETERYRIEMENKRTEMILQSQKRIVDTISRAVVGGGRLSS